MRRVSSDRRTRQGGSAGVVQRAPREVAAVVERDVLPPSSRPVSARDGWSLVLWGRRLPAVPGRAFGQRLTAALVLVYGTCWKNLEEEEEERNPLCVVCPTTVSIAACPPARSSTADGGRYKDRLVRGQPAAVDGRAGAGGNRYRWGWHVTGPVGWGCTDIFRGPNPRDFAGFVALGGGSGEQRGRRAGRVHRAAGVAGLLHVHGSAASGGQFNTEMAKKECPRLPDPASGHGAISSNLLDKLFWPSQ